MKGITACGTEPFDKHYGLGYQVGHDGFSPFERVNKLRNTFLERQFNVDIQRAKVITEIYKNNPGLSVKMKTALFLKTILETVDLEIYEDDLIVGEIAAPAKAAPVYPEFSVSWIIDELLHFPFEEREHDKFYITESDKKELLEILPFWEGKTVADEIEKNYSDIQKNGSEMGKKVYMTNLYHYAGVGHFVMDYMKLMKVGFSGLIEEVEEKLSSLTEDDESFSEKQEFYNCMIIELQAAITFAKRYADLAAEKANREKDEKRKQELLTICENCNQIAVGGAKTMWQALQLWHIATTVTHIESNGHSVSYGRVDKWLYPYYESDIENKVITKEFAQELLEVAYIKTGNPSKLKDRMTVEVRSGRGWGGESLTIGGVDEQGNDITNDLTFMLLEASVHTRMMNPWLCVRMHENTPYELKVKTTECIRAGYGHPKLFNDRAAIKSMMRKGFTLEEARDYEVVGCVEIDLPGREYGYHDAAYMNLAKVMELSFNSGVCVDCSENCPIYSRCVGAGKKLGIDSGNLATAKSFEEVFDSFRMQLAFWTENMCDSINKMELAHKKLKPLPYLSAFFEGTIESGKDVTEGGAKYNFTGPQAAGIGTCADTLATIRQLIFENKLCSGEELMNSIRNNWEGSEYLYALVNSTKVHHYGNDDDYTDEIFREIFEEYCRLITGTENTRGGYFCPGVYTVNANVGMGLGLAASIDGRKNYEPISDNMGPVHTFRASHDFEGPTGLINSVTKVDHSLATNGTLLNCKFSPECVSGIAGRENLISFVDTYFEKGGMHVQFNIMSTKMMRDAMDHPENYRDMLVRVAGYSAYFVELGKPLQLDLIYRTELSFS